MSEPTTPPTSGPGTAVQPSGAGILAFVVELAMLGLLAVAGARLGGNTAVSVLLAVVLVVAVVVAWGRWLAPRAAGRLARTPRLAAKAALFAGTTVLTVASGLVVPGVVFAVVAAGMLAWTRD